MVAIESTILGHNDGGTKGGGNIRQRHPLEPPPASVGSQLMNDLAVPVQQNEFGSDPGVDDLLERRKADAGACHYKEHHQTQTSQAASPDCDPSHRRRAGPERKSQSH
jgi:hypothetical protein